jgi:hypothetical protein
MLREFSKGTDRFQIKTPLDTDSHDEALITFFDKNEIRTFFDKASKCKITHDRIGEIARDVAPSVCRPGKGYQPPSEVELIEQLMSRILAGNLSLVLKNDAFKMRPKAGESKNNGAELEPERFDLLKLARNAAIYFKEICSKLARADYFIAEKVIHISENTSDLNALVVVDPSSVKNHSSGWKSWDDSFEIRVLGMFKGVAAFRIANFLKLGNVALAAAGLSAQSEAVTAEYLVTAKSINCRRWYGSYAIRYNLKSGNFEIPWVKYKKSGPNERLLVELKRRDRLMMDKREIYSHPELLIPPFQDMEAFLSDYKRGFAPPEYDINTPIILS